MIDIAMLYNIDDSVWDDEQFVFSLNNTVY